MLNKYEVKDIKISILVPVYNIEKYIGRCLESIINQTYQNLQIVVVNDGSMDNSGAICDEYARKDNRIQVIHKKNGGLVSARKVALEVANGEYVGFVDGDDWIEPNMYETLLLEMKKCNADMSICGYTLNECESISPSNNKVSIKVGNDFDNLINNLIINSNSQYNIIRAIWAKLFKYDLIVKSYDVPDNCSYGEDFIATINSMINLKKNGNILLIPDLLYHYGTREGSYTREKSIKRFYWILDLYKHLLSVVKDNNLGKILLIKLHEALTSEMSICLMKFHNQNDSVCLLYRIEDLTKLRGKRIIIYGAGKVGRDLYSQLLMENNITLVAWLDKKYDSISMDKYNIVHPDTINEYEFDLVIIAIDNDDIGKKIKNDLMSNGVCENKIIQGIHRKHYII